ncbi:hypothetical protein Mapa_010928 [Marchantia paleacea]|nr:hypothetical protein Mapa_010928 [Marchantia paleacea]
MVSAVNGVKGLAGNTTQQLAVKIAEQAPGQIQRLVDVAHVVGALRHEFLFELLEEFQVEEIFGRQSLLSYHGLHGLHVLADGVIGVQLVRHVGVVFPSHPLADGALHEPRQRRQHVDGRVDLPVLQIAVDVDLPLGDVPRQVGDGVRDVVVGHGQDGDLRDGALAALDSTCALVDGCQIRVHVAWVASAPGTSSREADTSRSASAYELMSVRMTRTCLPPS